MSTYEVRLIFSDFLVVVRFTGCF